MRRHEKIRYLEDDGVSAEAGLAEDELLLEQQGLAQPPSPTLRLYTYRSHCALVGRFQDLDAEVDVAQCERLGVAVNRRPTGGGAILMGADQLGVALVGPAAKEPSRAIMEMAARPLLAGLASLGVHAQLTGKNDLSVGARKLAGLGICRNEQGAFLFHASLLLDLDIELMLRVLRVPIEKAGGKGVQFVEGRLTTVRRELARRVVMAELRAALRAGVERVLGAQLEPAASSEAERAEVARLVAGKYLTPHWVRERSGGGDSLAIGYARAPGGLIRAQVKVAGGALQAAYLSADFVDAAHSLLPEIERRLRWCSLAADSLAKAVREAWEQASTLPCGVEPEHVVRALLRAVEAAARHEEGRYACFVGRFPDGGSAPTAAAAGPAGRLGGGDER
ncbi:MAG: lipoate--protein ligase family protein [Myxococcales bacterium]|nr:lipoate--protein ligase family protein [Myxococcales bacterium]